MNVNIVESPVNLSLLDKIKFVLERLTDLLR